MSRGKLVGSEPRLARRQLRSRFAALLPLLAITALPYCRAMSVQSPPAQTGEPALRWFKGNIHTHSLWSDGDHYPEMVVDWYRERGYHFLAMTDHNPPPPGERWISVAQTGRSREAYRAYLDRFGAAWVAERQRGGGLEVRLRTLDEYRQRMERTGAFVLVPGEEITQYVGGKAAHVNAINVAEPIAPQEGGSVREIVRKNVERVHEQRRQVGRPMIAQLNHPNFLWSVTAEDLAALEELRFFELYNAHPLVNNDGDALRPGTERMWDIALTLRLAAGAPVLYGTATDDAHDYHEWGPEHRNPGRGWIVVRAGALEPDALIGAMERGDFYASTGVTLDDVRRDGRHIRLEMRPEPGVSYVTRFIGTRLGVDVAGVTVVDSAGTPVARRYGAGIGAVLAEVPGLAPSYELEGNEVYVRAVVVSSRSSPGASRAAEPERAWTQPFVRPAGGW